MSNVIAKINELLKPDGAVALIMKQPLRPAEGKGEPIFPPTYPMPTYRGRVHTVRDGEYRVSVELPPFRQDGDKGKKGESKAEDVAGYNIDVFDDGSNICEIDSPQSQANRLEPLFKTIKAGKLVPQIVIKVGTEPVNLLDAGHRAADAVVRLSSLVEKFHTAFVAAKAGNHGPLGKLAPTSLLFGVWDSRGTQIKLPRIIKAGIRATNVRKLTRSAQFNPATDFISAGAVDETLNAKEGDDNPLSEEGLNHVPAPRAAGGVKVTGEIVRVVRLNLVALRELRVRNEDSSIDPDGTSKLQAYVLGLALTAATTAAQHNLREGCLLVGNGTPQCKLVKVDGNEDDLSITIQDAEGFAETAAKSFFGTAFDNKDILDGVFESGVANQYLAMPLKDRKQLRRAGPITADAIRKLKDKNKDPMKLVSEALKQVKTELGTKPKGKNATPVVKPEAFKSVRETLEALGADEQVDESVKTVATELLLVLQDDTDSHATLKKVSEKIKEFKEQMKEGNTAEESTDTSETEPA